jgi:AcrR family transcriptional regulator
MNVHSVARTGTAPVRERVLAAALELFARHGYFQTSLPDIQRRAGVSIGAIYRNFTSKDDLAAAVYDLVLDTIGDAFRECLDGDHDFLDRFRRLLGELFRLTGERPELIGYALYVKHREISQQLGPVCSSEPFVYLQARVAEAMRHGQLRSDDVVLTTATLMGPALRLIQLSLDGLLNTPLSDLVDPLVDNARRALAP